MSIRKGNRYESTAQYLQRCGWVHDGTDRLYWHNTLSPVTGMPLFKREAVERQRAHDRRVSA